MSRYGSGTGIGWKILSFFLAVIIIAGVVSGVVFWQKGNIVFTPLEQEQPSSEEVQDNGAPVIGENGDELENNATVPMPKAMSFRSATSLDGEEAAYDSVTIEATVLPETLQLDSFEFSVEWANSESTWASGKEVSDYLTLTQGGLDGREATLCCLRPFGEQIIVKATARVLNKEKSAECTVDFIARPEDFWVRLMAGGMPSATLSSGDVTITTSSECTVAWEQMGITWTDGTIKVDCTYSVTFKGNEAMAAKMRFWLGAKGSVSIKEYQVSDSSSNVVYFYGSPVFGVSSNFGGFYSYVQGSASVNDVLSDLLTIIGQNDDIPLVLAEMKAVGEYTDYSAVCNIYIVGSAFVNIDSVTLDQGDVIF